MSSLGVFRSQRFAVLKKPSDLLQRLFSRLSEDERDNILHDAWLHVTREQARDWCCHIIAPDQHCVHKVNLFQPDPHVNVWAFEFNTETYSPAAGSASGCGHQAGALARLIQ